MDEQASHKKLRSAIGVLRRSWEYGSSNPTLAIVLGALILAALAGTWRLVDSLGASPGDQPPAVTSSPDWGPPRRIYHCTETNLCGGGNHVSLDSTINDPSFGDERFFLAAKIEGDVGGVEDSLAIEPGDDLIVRMTVVNDAEARAVGRPELVARRVRASLELPREAAEELKLVGWVSARNASPKQVFDSLGLHSDSPVKLHLIDGSTLLINKAHPHGMALPNTLTGEGVTLGFDRLDGRLGVCLCETGSVIARLVITAA